jgi:hypothetical protein
MLAFAWARFGNAGQIAYFEAQRGMFAQLAPTSIETMMQLSPRLHGIHLIT